MLQALFEQAPCGYLTTTADGTITRVNQTFVRWTGHAGDDLVGKRLQSLMPIGDQILYSTHCQPQLAMVGAVAEIAIEVIGADGARRAALLSVARSPASDAGPAVDRVIIFGALERRRYEKDLLSAKRRAEESEARRAVAEAGLQHLVLHDQLTGLHNRAGFLAALDSVLADRKSSDGNLAVLFVDLDDFKAVNDSLGHAAGDELLLVVAQRLRASLRSSGVIARLSGDEFVVFDRIEGGNVGVLAQRLLDEVRAPLVIDGLDVVASASIGAVVADEGDDTAARLLRHADIAMYKAKARGRNCWERHDSSDTDAATDRLRLVGELWHGIERGELRVHYQPRMDLRTGYTIGVEALVRWQHSTRGLLSPATFIEVAERSGIIRPLGAWVLNEAVRQAVRWQTMTPSYPPVQVAVNLSPRQLNDGRLVDTVAGVLDHHRLDPALLTLEITETAWMNDPNTALRVLTSLKSLGVVLAVDDFGTGYSSLTHLKSFPFDELKIDRSFVAGLCRDAGDAAIVANCIQLAHALGIHVVAEGVEDDGQRRALIDLDCDFAQGYHFSPPIPAEAFAAWLAIHPTGRLTVPATA